MHHPHTLHQLALDRQRELLEEADRYRLIKQLSRSRREARAERGLYRVARRAVGMTARHALAPARAPSLGAMNPQPPRTATQPSRIDDLEVDQCDAELVSAGPSRAHTPTIESKTNFVRPVTVGTVEVTASIVHAGRSTIVVQPDTHRHDSKLVTALPRSKRSSPTIEDDIRSVRRRVVPER